MSAPHNLPHDRVNKPAQNDPAFFYPKEYYIFDNFSSFQVEYEGYLWQTSEHAFQAKQFKESATDVYRKIQDARSAHDAQKIAFENKDKSDPNWEKEKALVMKEILICKVEQHPYVLKKLIESGDREIIEDSWRDSEWGWGDKKNGENKLGKLWMEIRDLFKSR